MAKLGLIAGSGRFPILLTEGAASLGWEVVVLAVKGQAEESDFKEHVKTIHTISIDQIGKLIETLHAEKITDAVMVGKVNKRILLSDFNPDERTLRMFKNLKNMADDTLLGMVARELESEGITLHNTAFCVKDLLAKKGTLTEAAPTEKQWEDITFGWGVAKEIGRVDVGQTVVVKDRAVMAVEAIEGTDEAILRGGKLAGEGAVVVKVAKPQQDERFDMPVVGISTIESMKAANARVLAVETGWTLIVDIDQMLDLAKEAGIVIVSCTDPGADSA